jgi:hypothetical protein
MKKAMTFMEVLNSEYKYMVADIEQGSSDPEYIANAKAYLYHKTGYKWVD